MLPHGFLELPGEVYRGDPNWIPESPDTVAALFSEHNPWRGAKEAFCVRGKARAAGFRAPGLEVDGVPAAFFGYYESTGDGEAEARLFDDVRAWARTHGAQLLYGPINFTTAQPYRIRLSGPPDTYLDEPYNPLSYADQLEALDFALCRSYVSHDMDPADIEVQAAEGREIRDQLSSEGYRFESLTPEIWSDRADELFDVGNAVFASNFAFTPLRREELGLYFSSAWAGRLHPELSLIVFDPADRVAAISLVYPHYAPLAAAGAGQRRVPVADLSYAEHGAALSEVLFKTGGVSQAHREAGVASAMAAEVSHRALRRGVTRMLIGPMREDNATRRVLRHGHRAERWYGLYATTLR
jgi:hypothetical protein